MDPAKQRFLHHLRDKRPIDIFRVGKSDARQRVTKNTRASSSRPRRISRASTSSNFARGSGVPEHLTVPLPQSTDPNSNASPPLYNANPHMPHTPQHTMDDNPGQESFHLSDQTPTFQYQQPLPNLSARQFEKQPVYQGAATPQPPVNLGPGPFGRKASLSAIDVPNLQTFEVENRSFDIIGKYHKHTKQSVMFKDTWESLEFNSSHPPLPSQVSTLMAGGYNVSSNGANPHGVVKLRKRPTKKDRGVFNLKLDVEIVERDGEKDHEYRDVDLVLGSDYLEKLYERHQKIDNRNPIQEHIDVSNAHQYDWQSQSMAAMHNPSSNMMASFGGLAAPYAGTSESNFSPFQSMQLNSQMEALGRTSAYTPISHPSPNPFSGPANPSSCSAQEENSVAFSFDQA